MIGKLKYLFSPRSKQLRKLLHFTPGDINLYELAFTHSSARKTQKVGTSNERLEFLGDAILDSIISDYLYKEFPNEREGFLTQMRSKIVSRENLNELAVSMRLDKFIVTGFKPNEHPSLYGNALEALIGAIYLDKGYRFTFKFIHSQIIQDLLDLEELTSKEVSYKSRLLEWAQKEKKSVVFSLKEVDGPQHKRLYTIVVLIDSKPMGTGSEYSKKKAEQIAAKSAMEKLTTD